MAMSLKTSHQSSSLFDQILAVDSAKPWARYRDENESKTMEGRWPVGKHLRVAFADFVDLQTRLMLMPQNEDDGTGAIVSSYRAKSKEPNTKRDPDTSSEATSSSTEQNTAEPSEEHRDDDDNHAATESNLGLEGYILMGLDSKEEDWSETDFTEILALLREEAAKPLVLVFAEPEGKEQESPSVESATVQQESQLHTKEQSQSTTSENNPSECAKQEQPTAPTSKNIPISQESLQAGMSALSSWGRTMRAQATMAANNLSTVAKERAKNFQTVQDNSKAEDPKPCDIFLQTPVGAFVPVAVTQSKVTTASLLTVRKSATEPTPRSGWSYQWYRSSLGNEERWSDDTLSCSASSRSSVSTREAQPPASNNAEDEWMPVEGAILASFQPDATLMGRKLRCVVTMDREEDSASSDDSMEDSDLPSLEPVQEICEVGGVVSADATLFNGARQALARGAKFGALKGRGNANGRQFRIEISIGMPNKKLSRRTTSSLLIFQMSGQDAISLTPIPVLSATAKVPDCNPKFLDLQIAVPPKSVLSALCTDGMLQIETPNRLTRESFLMALGVANFNGKPADLDTKTILFKDGTPQTCLLDDEASLSSASCAHSVLSQGSGRKSPSPQTPGYVISPIQTVSTPGNCTVGTPNRSLVGTPDPAFGNTTPILEEENRVMALEQELLFLRGKLARKDKIVSELQRQVATSDTAHEKTKRDLESCRLELQSSREENKKNSESRRKAENQISSFERKMVRVEGQHKEKVSTLERRIDSQATKIADLEKANRSLQNEKAVLQAAVEARESKLTRMAELQASFEQLSAKVAQHDALRDELEKSQQRYESIQQDLRKVETVDKECREELESAKESISKLSAEVERERAKAVAAQASVESQVGPLQRKIQQLKGERNSYKQKNESLSKEVSRLCKNGRSVKEIEKILADHDALQEEVISLRKQKKKALEEAHQYRTSYSQSRAAQVLSGVEEETQAALERNVELERLLAETTEYINAKEMQLETMKQVNEQLQEEIKSLAQANLGRNEV